MKRLYLAFLLLYILGGNASAQWEFLPLNAFSPDTAWSFRFHFRNPSEGFAIADTRNGQDTFLARVSLYRTSDGGHTWNKVYSDEQKYSFGIDGNKDTVFATKGKNMLYRSYDFGQNWDSIDLSSFGGSGTPVYLGSGQVLVLQDTSILFSPDYGSNWTVQSSKMTYYNSFRTFFPGTTEGYYFDLIDRNVYHSTDLGITWTKVSNESWTPDITGYYVDFVTPHLAYAMVHNKLYRSTDSCRTWQVLKNVPGFLSYYYDGIQFINPRDGFHTVGNKLYKTNDSGTTWCEQPPYTTGAVMRLGFPSNQMYVLNDTIQFWACWGNSTGSVMLKTTNQGGPACPSGPGVSIDPWHSDWGIRVYPNPASNVLFVETDEISITRICLYSLSGQRMLELDANSTHLEIPLSRLGSGIYLIEVWGSSGIVYREKVLIGP